ncbi:flagellar basal-body rod protein FlgF [Guyparkeria sp. SCN-R1]|uniref:flagellar basal-body rod protein FlgF n=1 Tax=Guyparkeria sp. SCN-R1 TaxID=2341113 RepID=UPI000F64E763|nr:flagellar basal-body rod protein FlgF [Guyparkeria sp. SCN-R1]RRQ24165.1 flagellar basal-body rod protein FlgF [Guyparkeria sp. SCN-R1]
MDRLAYIAMSGASQTLRSQATNANNLANVNTQGFKADIDAFAALPVYGPGQASRAYTEAQGKGADLSAGPLMTTGRDLDIAVKGEGFMAVEAPDGRVAYTRRGDLHLTANGQLQTGQGDPVMGNEGPIAIPPAEKIDIHADGSISIIPVGGQANAPAMVDRIRLVNPDQADLTKGQDGRFSLREGAEEPQADAAVQVASGVLEGSNVNAVEAMVNMIEYGRMFETQSRMIRTADENGEAADRLMRLG